VRRFLQIVSCWLLISTGATMWYLYRKGFSSHGGSGWWMNCGRRGVEVTFSKLTLEPFRGLVAKDVKVFQNASRKLVIAKVDEVVVEANYAHAARGEPFLNALTLVDAALELPLDPKRAVRHIAEGGEAEHAPAFATEATTRGAAGGGNFRSAREGGGTTSQSLLHQTRGAHAGHAAGSVAVAAGLGRAAPAFLRGRSPELTVRFSGDVSRPETLVVEADLSGTKIRRGGYTLEALHVSGSWQNQSLVIPQFDARDSVGVCSSPRATRRRRVRRNAVFALG
jgi:hypothetical protein